MPWHRPTYLPDISLIIPVYRGGEALHQSLQRVEWFVQFSPLTYELVIVDDGADDKTRAALFDYATARDAVRYIRHEKNQGKGRSVADGVAVATAPIHVFTDIDLPYELSALERMHEELHNDQHIHFIVGSRRHPASIIERPYGFIRNLTSRMYNLIARAVLHRESTDIQCGMKGFRKDAARLLFSDLISNRFAFDTELFLRAEKFGLHFKEIPVTFHHASGSSVRVIPSGLSMLKELARMYVAYSKKK